MLSVENNVMVNMGSRYCSKTKSVFWKILFNINAIYDNRIYLLTLGLHPRIHLRPNNIKWLKLSLASVANFSTVTSVSVTHEDPWKSQSRHTSYVSFAFTFGYSVIFFGFSFQPASKLRRSLLLQVLIYRFCNPLRDVNWNLIDSLLQPLKFVI